MDHSALTPAAPRGASFRLPHPNRRTLVKGVAWSAPVLAVASSAPALAVSLEDDAQARAFMLYGTLAGIGLGDEVNPDLVEVAGVHAIATNHTATNEDANPLSLSVLEAINVNLGELTGALSTILTAATDTPVGAVNQYAFAAKASSEPEDAEFGGAGAVSDNGPIDLQYNGSSGPSLATLQLRHVLEQLTGSSAAAALVASVADLTLDIGAVAGRATMNAPVPVDVSAVTREYMLAYLHLLAESQLIRALGTALSTASPIPIGVDTSDLLNTIGDALGGLIGGRINATVTLDARQLTQEDPTLGGEALSLDLENGTLIIDVAPLLGHEFPGADGSLNGLAPNSRLFVDVGLPGDGVTSITQALKDSLMERLGKFIRVDIVVSASVLGVRLDVLSLEGTLEEILNGTARPVLLGGLPLLVPVSELLGDIGELVTNALSTLLDGDGVLAVALQGVNGLLESLFTVLGDPDILSLTVNAQNDPVNGVGPVPSYYQDLPAGRYDVAALHLETLGLIDLLNVSLARASVGENSPSSVGQSRTAPKSL